MVVWNWLNYTLDFHIKYFPAKNMKAITYFGTDFFFLWVHDHHWCISLLAGCFYSLLLSQNLFSHLKKTEIKRDKLWKRNGGVFFKKRKKEKKPKIFLVCSFLKLPSLQTGFQDNCLCYEQPIMPVYEGAGVLHSTNNHKQTPNSWKTFLDTAKTSELV